MGPTFDSFFGRIWQLEEHLAKSNMAAEEKGLSQQVARKYTRNPATAYDLEGNIEPI